MSIHKQNHKNKNIVITSLVNVSLFIVIAELKYELST